MSYSSEISSTLTRETTTRKERKAKAELRINRIIEALTGILESCAQSGLSFEGAACELAIYTERLIQKNPQDASLVRRARTEFLKRIKRGLEDNEENNGL